MVNHAMMNATVKITEIMFICHFCVVQSTGVVQPQACATMLLASV